MEQQPSHVEAYLLGKAFSEDFEEAAAINYHYDILKNEVQMDASASVVLEAAVLRAYDTLGEHHAIPGVKEFGYETAAYAWRWLNFRAAYLKDMQSVYEELGKLDIPDRDETPDSFGSYPEKLYYLQEQQAEAAEQLLRKNPIIYETFADLELERVRCLIDPEAMMVDPFALEEQFALRSLCRVLDRVTDHPDALRIDNTISCRLQSEDMLRPHVIEIIRNEFRNSRVYYTLVESEVITAGHDGTEFTQPLTSYRIDCRPHAVKLWTKESGQPSRPSESALSDAFDLFELAHKLQLTTRS